MNNLLHKQIIELFSIENFNIFQDEENYYFFRSLEDIDIECIKNGTITDNKGKIVRLITDREFYGETIYKKTDELSLEQIVEHIKQNYNKHTNCISFSSNANVILDYGRNIFNDRYIMLKVPKKEFGKNIVNAGCYMFEEINKVIEEYSKTITDDLTKYFFDAIDNAKTQEQLDNIKLMISKDYVDESKNIFVNGIEKLISSQDYGALNSQQNLLKNKIILKMDLTKKQILDKIGNKFLINVIGSAFSSLEIIHYNEVLGNITEISPELIDIFSLIQQVGETNEINNLKRILLDKINNGEIQTISFELEKYDVEKFKENLTLVNIYNLTKGNIEYGKAKNIYTKAYILAKSRLRKEKSLELLKKILSDNKYDNIIEYLKNNTYGVESEITNRMSNRNSINLSESVNLLISSNEQNILDYINSLNLNEIINILNNPFVELQKFIEDNYTNQYITENWFANSIIDLIDWSYYGIEENLSQGQRELLIVNLKKNNFMEVYQNLKNLNLKDAEIANTIILQIIRDSTEVDINDRFTLSELEEFLGCNKIIDTGIELKTYQKKAFKNINKSFNEKDYTSVILPTGTGKSYVALSEMHYFEKKLSKLDKNKHAKILYLAPNNYILSQLERIISTNYRVNFTDSDKDIVKKVFPNLVLSTYSYLASGTYAEDIVNDQYDLIIFDELHRTGAIEWEKRIEDLLENQSAKILGITATPERDVDRKDMSELFAKKYGYTDDDILEEEHLSYNMDLLEAIKKGIIHNLNVINCEYSLIKDGSLDDLELSIEDITDENLKKEKRREYESLRKDVAQADGIEKILKDNLKSDGKYIVFIPLTKNEEGKYINVESNEEITESQAQRMIKSYQDLMNQFLFSGEYLEVHKDRLSNIYEKINDNIELDTSDIDYLNNEKDNILLLTKLHINNYPNALQTLSNDMSIKIIKYMNWEVLQDSIITSILNEKMKHEVESYNMISDNSKKQNDIALANFNSSKSPKKKFMFVMDMLNEGVHVDRIDGIIWFRALNENSKILFLQQLGRCISAIGEDNKHNIPLVIDLVNNTLKVDILKGVKKEKSDLSKLIEISKWIEIYGFPNINSNDRESITNVKILKRIQFEYQSFLNTEKLEQQKVKRKILIEKIIEIGSEFDLWNYEFPNELGNSGTEKISEKEDLLSIFGIKGKLRQFSDLYKEVKDINKYSPEKYVELIRLYCETYNEWPKKRVEYKQVQGITGQQLAQWLASSGYNKGEFKHDEELKVELDNLKSIYSEEKITPEKYVELIRLYCEAYKEWPKNGAKFEQVQGITGHQLVTWLRNSGYNKVEFKYGEELKVELDNLKSIYLEERITPEKYVELIRLYCEIYNSWPKYRVEYKQVQGKTGHQLAQWLVDSEYNKGEFKYNEELKVELDNLKSQYSEEKITPEKYVELIKLYCETYNEWPKKRVEYKQVQGKNGQQLAQWLAHSGYNKVEFKYGEELKVELDNLKLQYLEEKIIPEKYVKLIRLYCETYNEWPKNGAKFEQVQGKTSPQLAQWLISSGYNKGEFKYGEGLKVELDNLKSQYSEEKITPEKYVELIKLYCETYNEWPKQGAKFEQVQEKTGHQLAQWLISSGYNKGEFKCGEGLKVELDNLKSKYSEEKKYVELIRLYCETYNEWPKKRAEYKQVQGKTSHQLAQWLENSGYNKGEFKYDEELKVELDNLKSKYSVEKITPEKYVELIKLYCETYNEWPKQRVEYKQVQGKTGHQLAHWLISSGYNKGEFKYGEELKVELENLKATYYKAKQVYDMIEQSLNEESHFQKVVDNLQKSKENSNGGKVS